MTDCETLSADLPRTLDLAVSGIGMWETNSNADRTIADEATAALFGVDPEQALHGLPLQAYARAIHHDDLRPLYAKLGIVRTYGGLFVVEYRTHPQPGRSHRILTQGRYERDGRSGEMIGRGIVIDITESRLERRDEERMLPRTSAIESMRALERAADYAIAAREAIDQISEPSGRSLRQRVDALLWDMGRVLARKGNS